MYATINDFFNQSMEVSGSFAIKTGRIAMHQTTWKGVEARKRKASPIALPLVENGRGHAAAGE